MINKKIFKRSLKKIIKFKPIIKKKSNKVGRSSKRKVKFNNIVKDNLNNVYILRD